MPLSSFQRDLCRLLSASRIASGQSYVAGGSALNEVLGAPRLSRDVDVFHDTLEALDATWQSDRELLKAAHYGIDILRERSGFVEAEVHRGGGRVLVQWLRDSAFRFFPLQAHPDLGLTLHPFDAATNKMLALAGREEPRDWIDALTCHHKVAPLGLLAWAACGKDEGWNPQLILEEAARNARMSRAELDEIEWDGIAPDFAVLKGQWREAWREAHLTLEILPPAKAGKAVLPARPYYRIVAKFFGVTMQNCLRRCTNNSYAFTTDILAASGRKLKFFEQFERILTPQFLV